MRTVSVAWGGASAIAASGRRFELLEVIGRGAYGDVYLAEQHSGGGFRRKVAIKVLNDEVVSLRGAGRRMRDEARILGLLSHRHIVAVHDLIQVDDRSAILMDYIPGADLERVIEALAVEGARFPVSAALEAGAAVLSALEFATNAEDGNGGRLSVIHRDIKPSNVRLTPDGDLKVLDFGVARFSHECRESQTRATAWIGTERYMSPERLLREGETEAGDVYSAGATVMELILGEPIGRSPITAAAHAEFVNEALVRVKGRIEGEAHVVNRILVALSRSLRADPARRPDAGSLSRELEALSRRIPGPSLKEFARDVVPRVDGLLQRRPEPVSGMLLAGESSTRGSEGSGTVDHTDPAIEAVFFAGPPAQRAPSPLAGGLWGFAAAMVATLALLGGGAAAFAEGLWLPVPSSALTNLTVGLPAKIGPTVEAPKVEWAVVGFEDGARVDVTCGDVSAFGSGSVRIADFPAGPCRIGASWLGERYTVETFIERPSTLHCELWDGRFWCS